MSLRRVVRQEILARNELTTGEVVGAMRISEYDGSAPVFVADIDVGAGKILRDVPVKGGSGLKRTYASLGQTVALRRNALGRLDAIAQGDRKAGITGEVELELETGAETDLDDVGFDTVRRPFSFYQGPTSIAQGAPDLTFTANAVTRSTGSFVTDGFAVGLFVLISGTPSNDGAYGPIDSLSASTLNFTGSPFAAEGPVAAAEIGHGSRWNNGVDSFPKVATVDAQGNEV